VQLYAFDILAMAGDDLRARWAGWRPGWRGGSGGWGWGWPVAAGVAASNWGYYDYPYAGYSQCLFWNGFAWVSGCYQTYGYW
jgi:hypothetical protein